MPWLRWMLGVELVVHFPALRSPGSTQPGPEHEFVDRLPDGFH